MSWVSDDQAGSGDEEPSADRVSPTRRLADLGLTLPPVATPLAAYAPASRSNGMIFSAGQLPMVDGVLSVTGTVGADVNAHQAAEAARTCALNALAAVAAEAGGLDEIDRIVKVVVYVASAPDFTAQPAVADGASKLFGEVFGGTTHARSAVGVSVLPLGAPVEVEIVAKLAVRARIEPLVAGGTVTA